MIKSKVLIVEDDAIIAEDVRHSLQKLNYDVSGIAVSGEEAIKKASQLNPDLVLMDIVLKGAIDGIKAAGHIIGNFNIPVVYLTSQTDRATLKRARETGPFGYLTKPFDEQDMAATLEMALYKSGMERRLKENEQWLSIILKSIGDAVIVSDSSGMIRFLNPAAEAMTGFRTEEATNRKFGELLTLLNERDRSRNEDVIEIVVETGAPFEMDDYSLLLGKEGKEVFIDPHAAPLKNDAGEVTGVVVVLRDVTERRRALKLVEKNEQFLSTIFDSIRDPFCTYDATLTITRVNDAYARIFGKTTEDLTGRQCHVILHGSEERCENCLAHATLTTGQPKSRERRITLSDGTTGWFESFTYPIMDESGKVTHVIEYSRDITDRRSADEERRRLIKELEYLSRVDALTGLLNRRALMDFITRDFERSVRYGRDLSVMLCDIDFFKQINDTHGHAAGDKALEHVASVMREMVRSSDVVGRYGGDEFMMVMPETPLSGARDLAEKIRLRIEHEVLRVDPKKTLTLTLSIGVASMQREKDSVDFLVTRADAALYASKRQGKNRVSVVER